MKPLFATLLLLISFTALAQEKKTLCKNSTYVLEQSIKHHDGQNEWANAKLEMVIREPRLSVPGRFSNVSLDNRTGAFSLERDRDNHVSTHLIDAAGKATTLLDGKLETDSALIKQFRLEPIRNANYRNYYRFMYGAPMTLSNGGAQVVSIDQENFQGEEVIAIDFALTQPMIAEQWRLFFSPYDYRVVGLKTIQPAGEEGEYLVFNGNARVGNMQFPRFRHWYDSKTDEYLGSDMLIKAAIKKAP